MEGGRCHEERGNCNTIISPAWVVLKAILGIAGEKVSIFILSRYVDDTPESRPSLSAQVPGRLYWGCRAVGTQD